MDFLILDLLKVSTVFWMLTFGFLHITSELFSNSLPVTLILITGAPIILNLLRIKPPSKEIVEAVIGKDPAFLGDEDSRNVYVMRTVAHRGAGLDAPENSLVAFKMCSEKGCDAVEFDVTLTADNVPIIFHDDTLERLTDSYKVVRRTRWEDLCKIDISVKHPLREKFKETRIASLEDTILQCINCKQRMFIDIKECDSKLVSIILELYEKYPQLYQLAVCTSFFPNVIYMIRRAKPSIVCSLTWRPYFFSYDNFSSCFGKGNPRSTIWIVRLLHCFMDKVFAWALPQILYYVLGISIILLHKEAVSGEVIYKWRAKGIRVMVWTVNQPIEKQFFSRNHKVTYFTDTLIGESTAHHSMKTQTVL